jgi:hypothetical protein
VIVLDTELASYETGSTGAVCPLPRREVRVKSVVRRRFWVEAGLAVLAALLAALTAIRPDWIEALTATDPDAHSGSLEWAVVAGLVAMCVVLTIVARTEFRRSRPAARAAS